MTYDTQLGWKLLANTTKLYRNEEVPYLIQTNSRGLRDKEYSYQKPASVYRIVVLGDSFVFGSGGVEQDQLFTEIIEASVDGIEVINMGIPAFSPDQEYLLLKSEGLRYQPDLVILCLFANDFEETFVSYNESIGRPKGYVSAKANELNFSSPEIPFLYALSHYSYILGQIENRFRIVSHRKTNTHMQMELGEKKRIFEQLLTSLISMCRDQGVELWALYFPFRGQTQPHVIQKILQSLNSTVNLKCIDFMKIFDELNLEQSPFFKKDIHFNRYGHKIVAKTLSDLLSVHNDIPNF